MYYSRILLLIASIIGAVQLNAQDFTSKKDLKNYYKENSKQLPSPQEGWHEVWVIMPSESDYITDLKEEVVDASVLVKNGEVLKVLYHDYKYAQTVYASGTIKNGKASYQNVFLNINNNLTEVFTAYNHTVIFKKEDHESPSPFVNQKHIGEMTFFSAAKKVEKQGFFVFVKNENTDMYDFMGYLNKKCSEVKECNEENGLHFYIKSGNYEMLAVQNKIQFNRHMPVNTYNVMIEEEAEKVQEIVAKK
ncbi:hypothetical protein [Flammeovirga sp. SJP92]|uniref:hypothetical protein n=1 Tax=Flammeovirga sp. SJP92 TaxID=1775430 RepID=UPI000787F172|nr:hypothetical protein [Flammeovirga sp. SJP92]KXX67337.1 hypothetical protein AVL50_28580 [Flammeovirga sp. SJP92]